MNSIPGKIAVIGAGAIGSFYGAKLAKAGYDVEFLTRSGAKKLKNNAVNIKSIWGNFKIKLNAFSDTKFMSKADLIIISTKVLPSINYKKIIAPIVKKDSIILCIQNGMNVEEKLSRIFPKNTVLGGLAFTCINRISPIKILHLDYGLIKIAPLLKENFKTASLLTEIFNKTGIQTEAVKNLRKMRWQKLLWNIPFNSLSVVCGGITTDKIVDSNTLTTLAADLMKETLEIAKAEGIIIPGKIIQTMITTTQKMNPYKTSMLLDYENKREMEIETIVGEPLRIAKKLKVKTPVLDTIYKMLLFRGNAE